VYERRAARAFLNRYDRIIKEVILISETQVNYFAGNMMQLRTKSGDKLLIMSDQSLPIFESDQNQRLEKYEIIHPDISTIESLGGGSVLHDGREPLRRCESTS
jgi:hypothetical protein